MSSDVRAETRWALWAGIVVFLPLGLVLWWIRRGVGREPLVSGEDGYQALEIRGRHLPVLRHG